MNYLFSLFLVMYTNKSLSWGKVVLDQSYKCAKGLTVSMGKASFYATDLQFQAYKVTSNKFGTSMLLML